ncbi:hypothetical protein WN51_13104 [Melipona quadrifasciata]|uniref:Mos1 transposase HTH domain-containing protein n=1 Tax=Melipona quadrifasciata TaxID=166423 RepID=A0A0M9A069_9HYME|nr:hypothetical protein WN51_13104 [Melipona quadrifasciata]
MENQKQHFRHILFFYYRKGKNAIQAKKKQSTSKADIYKKLLQLTSCTLPHLPYSLNLAPSDVKNHLNQFYVSKDQKF